MGVGRGGGAGQWGVGRERERVESGELKGDSEVCPGTTGRMPRRVRPLAVQCWPGLSLA